MEDQQKELLIERIYKKLQSLGISFSKEWIDLSEEEKEELRGI